ncbi:MAG: serine/threonine-protein kinase [Gemmataceae bacterium]
MIGSRLGSWQIEAELGRGGMGTVYRASRVCGTGAGQAAVKVLAAELAMEVGFQQRFQREITILEQLDHPNIVRFYESGQERNRFWYAMELIDGPTYEALRDERGRVPWPEVLDLAWQIAPALKHAHDRGVIHRDLKPSNLMRSSVPEDPTLLPRIKLTDFGISSLFASQHLTVTGGVIGTPEYLSPEQAAGKPVTKKSDLYSLGVVLYTLIVGHTPFQGEPVDLLHKHRYAQFDRPGRIIADLPPDLDEIICQLMAKDPSERIPDAGVLFRRLDSLRRKLIRIAERRTDVPVGDTPAGATAPSDRVGPATLASQFVRQELEEQRQGGPLAQVFHHPAVLLTLFVLCLGALIWTFTPSSPSSLFERGAALMRSPEPDDWELAWERYLGPLEERFPDHPYHEALADFRKKLEDSREERKAERLARQIGSISDPQWFFERGLRQRRAGDEAGARRTWQALIAAYEGQPAARPWLRRAQEMLAVEQPPPWPDRLAGLRQALRLARAKHQAGDAASATAIRDALRLLYAEDTEAQKLIEED